MELGLNLVFRRRYSTLCKGIAAGHLTEADMGRLITPHLALPKGFPTGYSAWMSHHGDDDLRPVWLTEAMSTVTIQDICPDWTNLFWLNPIMSTKLVQSLGDVNSYSLLSPCYQRQRKSNALSAGGRYDQVFKHGQSTGH